MQHKYPFYLKSTIILFGLILLVYTIFNLKEILIPISFSLMLAILLNPLANWFHKKKIPRVLSIALSMLIAIIAIMGIAYFLSSQIANFSDQLPLLKKKFTELFAQLQATIDQQLNINIEKQNQWIAQTGSSMQPIIGQTLGTVVSSVALIFLLPVYTFLFLFYKSLILNFLHEVFAEKNSKEVAVVLSQTKGAIQSYMVGLLLEALIVATLNSIALLILGVKYAILLGVIGAILNVIPYIGGIIAIALPLIIATITEDGFHTQLGIIVAYIAIQFIDNHFLVPYIVSSKVKINALISIITVLLGGAVWGLSGMFLSIPFVGVLKIICDKIPELKPWGKLLGDETPTRRKDGIWKRMRKKKSLPEKTAT
jgi:predicted PurR-regulated permease PerM